MEAKINLSTIFNWVFAIIVMVVGILNIVLVHPVPGIVYLLLSLVYFPPATAFLKEKTGFAVPLIIKIILAIIIVQFTLGVSDLGDMIDKL